MTPGEMRQERFRGKRNRSAQLLALAGIGGPILFVLVFTIEAGCLQAIHP